MEARGKEYHDVSLRSPSQPNVVIGYFLEDQGRDLLPHLESPAHCLHGVVPAQLLGVVLDAVGGQGDKNGQGSVGYCPWPLPS